MIGIPVALHAFAIDVRKASAPLPANNRAARSRSSRGDNLPSSASASTECNSTQSARRDFIVEAREPHTATLLVVVTDQRLVDTPLPAESPWRK